MGVSDVLHTLAIVVGHGPNLADAMTCAGELVGHITGEAPRGRASGSGREGEISTSTSQAAPHADSRISLPLGGLESMLIDDVAVRIW